LRSGGFHCDIIEGRMKVKVNQLEGQQMLRWMAMMYTNEQ